MRQEAIPQMCFNKANWPEPGSVDIQSTFLLVCSPILRIIPFCDLCSPALVVIFKVSFRVHLPSEV